MPSQWQVGPAEDYQRFPEAERLEGEDPARWLHQSLHQDFGDGSSGEIILARIRGIESASLVRAYRAVEYALHDSGRNEVLTALEKRERELIGEGDQ